MSAKRPDISQVRKYLNGELDTRAMHELERQALDDPFLQDALEGYQHKGKDQQASIQELSKRLKHRTSSSKRQFAMWPTMAVAASVLLFIAVGGWWLVNNRALVNTSSVPGKDNTVVVTRPLIHTQKEAPVKADTSLVQPDYTTPELKQAQPLSMAKVRVRKPKAEKFNQPTLRIDEPVGNAPVSAAVTEAVVMDSSMAMAGKPGSNQTIRIRGASSVTSANTPLYIVDGKAGKIDKINPADIKDISILKDASATALYGSRAANGVVIVTTKKGKPGKLILDSNLIAKNMLKDVVIIGYGTQKRKDIAGSVSSVTQPPAVEQALAGRVAGVQVGHVKRQKASDIRTITGKVIAEDGLPLPGVNIAVAGKNKSTLTDAQGKFKIEVTGKDELDIEYVGFLTKRLKVKGNDTLNVALEQSNQALSEVVVVTNEQSKAQVAQAHPFYGWSAFKKYLAEKAQSPDNKEGVVKLSFVVNPDKTLDNFKIIKSLSADADQKAINMVKDGPEWIPNVDGKTERVKVRVRFKKK